MGSTDTCQPIREEYLGIKDEHFEGKLGKTQSRPGYV